MKGNLKPDLVVITPTHILISDVAITSDAEFSLNLAYSGKVAKYTDPDIFQHLLTQYPGREIKVLPLILTARGIYDERNDLLLELLKSKSLRDLLVVRTMEYGVRCWKDFNKFVSFT